MLFGPASATEPDAEPEVAFLLQSVDVDVGAALLRVRTWHAMLGALAHSPFALFLKPFPPTPLPIFRPALHRLWMATRLQVG